MAKFYTDFPQRCAKWDEMRAGIPTASVMSKIITPKTMQISASAGDLMNTLIAEWVMGTTIKSEYESEWMQIGREYEDEAVKAFEFQREVETVEVGFVTTDNGLIGCSPDRLIVDAAGKFDGSLEAKCPKPNTHVAYLLDGGLDAEYKVQIQTQLWVCEFDKGYAISYRKGMPSCIVETGRDEKFISALSSAANKFVELMLEKRAKWIERFGEPIRPKPKAVEEEHPFGVTMDDLEFLFKED